MKYSISAVLLSLIFFSQAQVVKVVENALDRKYQVLFSAPAEHNVKIQLLTVDKAIIMEEDVTGKAFIKNYSLSTLNLGNYTWKVTYPGGEFKEDFEIKSIRALMKESISVALQNSNLDINVKSFNKDPINIFLFNKSGTQLDHVFWQPDNISRSKKIDLTRYSSKEIKLEIVQNGDLAFKDEFKLY